MRSIFKRLATLGLAGTLLLGNAGAVTETATQTSKFDDVPADAWYAEAVNALANTSIIMGGDGGLFYPDKELTIGEWCTILWRIYGYDKPEDVSNMKIKNGGDEDFMPHWAAYAVSECRSYGLTYMGTGSYKNPTYDEDKVTQRGEAVTAIMYILKKAGKIADYTGSADSNPGIPDYEEILANVEPYVRDAWAPGGHTQNLWWSTHHWDNDAVVAAYTEGVVKGTDELGTFAPSMNLTRAQACQILYNAGITTPLRLTSKPSGGIY